MFSATYNAAEHTPLGGLRVGECVYKGGVQT